MSATWKSIYAYTASTDLLLTDVVGPFLDVMHSGIHHGFWERHFAGGPHVRIRLCGRAPEVSECSDRLKVLARDWIDDHPSCAVTHYSREAAARLLELEGVIGRAEDLASRLDCVIDGSYPDALGHFASDSARRLYENFRCARGPLALNIIRLEGDRRDAAFGLYLVLALTVGRGDYAVGSVSFKSHWEGFYATFASEPFLRRVDEHYRQQRGELCAAARTIRARWQSKDLHSDRILSDWHRILKHAEDEVTASLQRGDRLFNQFASGEDVVRGRESLFGTHVLRTSKFVERLWSNEEFMLRMQRDLRFLRPRVLVNFLYELVSALGISALDRMALCHHAFRVVEELCEVSLDDYLSRNMVSAVNRDAANG